MVGLLGVHGVVAMDGISTHTPSVVIVICTTFTTGASASGTSRVGFVEGVCGPMSKS